ncbi:MAG TPA: glutamate synthase subunit alpha, partial [Cyanobacteria bacterium UBA11372]|nr:glutamate synthase subunit alpha [Cyanobacteria bacterium UBA11372]
GDGSGLMTAIPWEILHEWAGEQGIQMPPAEQVGVGMVFLPQDNSVIEKIRPVVADLLQKEGLTLIGWRQVPVYEQVLGVQARENEPQIEQLIVGSEHLRGDELERHLYLARKQIEKAVLGTEAYINDTEADPSATANHPSPVPDFYICSFSSRTIVYKGMVRAAVLGEFYADLKNPAYKSPFAVYHRRFSTNTMPKWPLAQPMRLLGHNGEINTLLGNINWMVAREADLAHPIWEGRLNDLKPIVNVDNSDSATLDNVLELLVRSGRSPMEALTIMVPEAYRNQPELDAHPEIVDFYEYYSGIQEPWDGPALLVFGDGKKVGATLDRNGLRPARYCVTRDRYIIVASEAGVVDIPEAEIVEKGRLGPGCAIAVDLETKEVLKNWEIKQRVASRFPYGEWLKQRQKLETQSPLENPQLDAQTLLRHQTAFGYTAEDVEMVIEEMAASGKEPTYCMGDDIPLAVLSSRPHLLYDYFKQRFAQVTNPAIDPLREKLVMSLSTYLGEKGNLLEAKPEYARVLQLDSPVLSDTDLEQIRTLESRTATISTLFDIATGPDGLAEAVRNLCAQATELVQNGTKILVLSDRVASPDLDTTYIPPLLAVGAVHHHLIRQNVRMKVSLVVDTAQCWSTHHFACLIGYGASAVCPYLALESVRHWWSNSKTQSLMERGKIAKITVSQAQKNFRKAVEDGLLKILSKMGISLLSSYQAAQIFEAIGIGPDLLNLGFKGTASRVGGLSVRELANEVLSFHQKAFPELTLKKLENFGFVAYRPGGEYHMNSPEMSKALHKAVAAAKSERLQIEEQNPGSNLKSNQSEISNQKSDIPGYDHYEVYQKYLQGRPVTALRDLLEFKSDRSPIPLEEVES